MEAASCMYVGSDQEQGRCVAQQLLAMQALEKLCHEITSCACDDIEKEIWLETKRIGETDIFPCYHPGILSVSLFSLRMDFIRMSRLLPGLLAQGLCSERSATACCDLLALALQYSMRWVALIAAPADVFGESAGNK